MIGQVSPKNSCPVGMPQANVLCVNSYEAESVMPPALCCLRMNIYTWRPTRRHLHQILAYTHLQQAHFHVATSNPLHTLQNIQPPTPDSYLFESCHTTVSVHHRTASAHSCASRPETSSSGTRFSASPNGTERDSEGRIISGFNVWRRGDW